MSAKELNIGDYVRTKDGTISKIESKRDYTHGDYKGGENDFYLNVNHSYQDYEEIINSSPNIIDLIEVGDYVNGHRVIDYMLENGKRKGIIVDADIWGFDIDEIKSIVTKEQFEAMKYEIGDKE